jgi:hypothetical protein
MEDIYQVHYVAVGISKFCISDVSMRGHKSSPRQYVEWDYFLLLSAEKLRIRRIYFGIKN